MSLRGTAARAGAGWSGASPGRFVTSAKGGYRTYESGETVRVSVAPTVASRMFAARVTGSSAAGFRSLSAARASATLAPARPSPQLQTIIREREVSRGPGWLGTAALVWLLSRHDLSDDDRRWVASQMSSSGGVLEDGTSVNRVGKNLTFVYEGLPEAVKVGQTLHVVIAAIDEKHRHQALSCGLIGPGNTPLSARTDITDSGVSLTWTAKQEGITFLQCDGLAEGERRAIDVRA